MFNNYFIDELTLMREEARSLKDWKLSDEIREYLDTKNVFCVDTAKGQVVYHIPKPLLTREEALNKVKDIIWKN